MKNVVQIKLRKNHLIHVNDATGPNVISRVRKLLKIFDYDGDIDPKILDNVMVIYPYKTGTGYWVFDDAEKDLVAEGLVDGIDDMLDTISARYGVTRLPVGFSSEPIEDHDVSLQWVREGYGGNIYYSPELDHEGWLCPALFRYFDEAPKNMYIKVLSMGIDSHKVLYDHTVNVE